MKKKNLLPVIGDLGDKKLCPSFSPRRPGKGWVFGVVTPTDEGPRMVALEKPEPVTEETFAMAAPLHPSEVFRITSPCVEGHCKNFGEGGICHLGHTVSKSRAEGEDLPVCQIRPECVWWHQEGPAACAQCSKMVTNNEKSRAMRDEMGR